MKKKIALLLGLTLGFTAISCSLPLSKAVAAETEPTNEVIMFRLYNSNSGEHFFTGDEGEKADLVDAGWSDEGIGWIAPVISDSPVYRLYNGNVGDHHYTLNINEKDNLVRLGWNYEGIGWYSDDDKSVPLYREFNPNAVTGTHNYTTSKTEHDNLVKAGWKDEGIGWYGINDQSALTQYWTSGSEVAESLRSYVKKVTNENDKTNFIPVKDRIAVFDMDGTLTCETYYTYYDTMMFINYCLYDHPERVSEELKAAAAEIKPGYTAGEELARNFAKAYAGMTIKELYDYAVEFGQKKTDSFNNMRYIDGFYLPMVEVVKYLYDNGFTIYVVSGTERTTTRAIVANSPIKDYVSPAHVIGSEFEVKVKGHETTESNMDFKYSDGDELVFTGGFIQKNLNANKTIWIEREIGQYPVLAFGNSGSDTSMMNYALDKSNPYPSEAYMVVADDDVREWGKQNWEEKSAQYKEQGYVPVSMKNDFAEIYPSTISRADKQYIEPQTELQAAAKEDNIIQFPGQSLAAVAP